MKPKHQTPSIIPQFNPKKLEVKTDKYINKDAAIMYGWLAEGDKANLFISLRFVQHEYQCFFEWSKAEMRAFWDFLEKAHSYTWQNLFAQSRKEAKAGLAYTVIPLGNYPAGDFKDTIDPNSTFFELRVNDKARVHCFRDKSICYICWLDKNHVICN